MILLKIVVIFKMCTSGAKESEKGSIVEEIMQLANRSIEIFT